MNEITIAALIEPIVHRGALMADVGETSVLLKAYFKPGQVAHGQLSELWRDTSTKSGLFRPGCASALEPRSHSIEDTASMPEQRPDHFCLMCKSLNKVTWDLQK